MNALSRENGLLECECGVRFDAPMDPASGEIVMCPECGQQYEGQSGQCMSGYWKKVVTVIAMTENHTITELRKELARAEADSARLSEKRSQLPPGSSRARVTTANARWAAAAEHRDWLLKRIEKLLEEEVNR